MKRPLTIGFIGLGLIGGSIAKAIRYYYPDTRILAHTRSHITMDYAVSRWMNVFRTVIISFYVLR